MGRERPGVTASPTDAPNSKAFPREVRLSRAPLQAVLGSGQAIVVSEVKAVYEIKPVKVEVANAWRNGRLVFHEKPLEYVIDEINRYLDNKIIIGDKQLESLKLSLDFKIKHRDKFLEALEMTIPIKTLILSDGRIVLLKS